MTYIIMGVILAVLGFMIIYNAKYTEDSTHFFDLQNTNAMRGFWCIIIVLVHIPAMWQNGIQDMIGSFAYIGVTFFFMTSAYGLKLDNMKNPQAIKTFWIRRIPKLIVPNFLVNIIALFMKAVEGNNPLWSSLFKINGWVIWLLACYVIFWLINCFVSARGGERDLLICLLIAICSFLIYSQKDKITVVTWCPEVFGFVWGILLADFKEKFCCWLKSKWIKLCITFCIVAGVLGVLYLKFKPVVFWGDYLLKIALGLAIILFMLALNVKICIGNKTSHFLGKVSYEVYLLHGEVFGLIAFLTPEIDSGLFILASILITVFLAGMVSRAGKAVLMHTNDF